MALDVYVMPLWRFKAGDFTSPLEKVLGVKPTIISLAALPSSPPAPPPWYWRALAKIGLVEILPPEDAGAPLDPAEIRAGAVAEVEALKEELSRQVGQPLNWADEGDVHYNQQYHHPITLRAFAAWYDHRDELPHFSAAPKLNYHEHPVWKLPKPASPRFPTLIGHGLHTGYFLPVPFEGNYQVEPFKVMNHWEFFHDVASTRTVQRELADLLSFMASVPEVRDETHGCNPVADARWYAEELQRICALSVEHGLPVIFYG